MHLWKRVSRFHRLNFQEFDSREAYIKQLRRALEKTASRLFDEHLITTLRNRGTSTSKSPLVPLIAAAAGELASINQLLQSGVI